MRGGDRVHQPRIRANLTQGRERNRLLIRTGLDRLGQAIRQHSDTVRLRIRPDQELQIRGLLQGLTTTRIDVVIRRLQFQIQRRERRGADGTKRGGVIGLIQVGALHQAFRQ